MPRGRAYTIFKVVPGLIGIPAVIVGSITDSTALLVVGFIALGVYVTEMAVITPVVIARRSGRRGDDES